MRYLFLVPALLLMGCASIKESTGADPYFEIGAGYQINEHSDWYVRTHRTWQCRDNLKAKAAVGLSWGNTEVEYEHQSWWLCGTPFNNKPELYQDSININHRWEFTK
jgi:hypothetical protein